jgi:hypothetical protein
MDHAFEHFMTGLVDYAGLFPPAALPMGQAVTNYAAYRAQDESWMLGRFIVPAGRLEEMVAVLPAGFAAAKPWRCSVLVGHPGSTDQMLAQLPVQLSNMAHLHKHHAGSLAFPAVEMPIPLDAMTDLDAFLTTVAGILQDAELDIREVYGEVPAGGDPQQDPMVLAALSRVGFRAKFRCGGVTPEAFPSPERLAGVIHHAAALGLPLKCTAGLHHPVRHQSDDPPVMMHGFLNVFGAGLLALAHQLDVDHLVACLQETDPAAFTFHRGAFRWQEHEVSATDVARWRSRMLSGFGSCSFDEPRDDLRKLGLLA